MANKVSDLSIEQFENEVKKYDGDLYEQCVANGIDVLAILKSHKPTCNALSIRAGVATARGRLQREFAALTAEYKTGIILGSSDRYNARSPLKITLLQQDGTIVELSTFDARAKMDGRKVDIVYPSVVKVMVRYDEKWQNWNLQEFVSMVPISKSDLVSVLEPIAISPGNVGVQHEKSTIVVKGIISGVAPAAILVYDEDEDRYFRDGEFEVLEVPTGPKDGNPMPCMGIRLASERDKYDAINYITVNVGKQRYGTPHVDISDLIPMCQHAMDVMGGDPTEQCKLVADGVKGLVVYAIGYMGAMRQDRDDNMENVNYVNLNATCVVESGQFVGADGQIMDVSDFGESEGDDDAADAAPTPASKKAPAKAEKTVSQKNASTHHPPAAEPEQPKDSVDLPPLAKPATVTEEIAAKHSNSLSLTKIRNGIVGYLRVSQLTPDAVTAEEIHPYVAEGKAPVAVIEVVLEDLREEAANRAAKV